MFCYSASSECTLKKPNGETFLSRVAKCLDFLSQVFSY